MVFCDVSGEFSGFSVVVMQVFCEEMWVICNFQLMMFEWVIEDIVVDWMDVVVVSLFDMLECWVWVIFVKLYFCLILFWFVQFDVFLGQIGVCIVVVWGLVQECFVCSKGWEIVVV